ncbi:hypothetical protein CN311_15740 [Mesorhizobium sanjuanii]|uniref:Uncharacterized protein n=1 Tax=Mesorhizobium sanjuanii TaxID=2037900 RepID=A0A2A6FDU3_9HYPH|nr:hypothetical protein CN311_15740 [Mesorhizobium sanjuanii]
MMTACRNCAGFSKVRRDLAQWLAKWETRCPKLCQWVEDNIEETLTFNRLPRQHHKRLKSTNILERLIRRSSGASMWCASFPAPRAACGSSACSPSKHTKPGWRPCESQHGAPGRAQEGDAAQAGAAQGRGYLKTPRLTRQHRRP